jgi:ABC-type bacteriocin/lantibiotic exporter with double-glycine peptidase domain
MSSAEVINSFAKDNIGLIVAYFIINIIIIGLETIVLSRTSSKIYSEITNKSKLYTLFTTFIAILLIVKIFYITKNYLYDVIVPKFNEYVRNLIFNNIIERYQVDYKELNTGYILYHFHHIPGTFSRFLMELLEEYVPNIIAIIICIGYLYYINRTIGFASIVFLIAFIVIVLLCIPKCMELSLKEHELAESNNKHVQDRVSNLFNIYTSNTEAYEKSEYKKVEGELTNTTIESYVFTTVLAGILQIFAVFLIVLTFYTIYKNYEQKDTSTYVLLIVVASYFSGYINRVSANLIGLANLFGQIGNIDDFLGEIEPNKLDQINATNVDLNGPIDFKNVSFMYPKTDATVLSDLNLYINKYSKIAILGKSGSGKTTIIKLLLGFYTVNSGSITINGYNIKDVDIHTLRKNIGILTQNIKLFDKTLAENIIYGTNATITDAENLIRNFNITIFEKLTLDSPVGTDGSNLSGGQKQVVNFLRAILKNTPILILDEPTSALDANTKNVILGMIDKINDKTIIIITHDDDVLPHVDYSYQMKNNRLMLMQPTSN